MHHSQTLLLVALLLSIILRSCDASLYLDFIQCVEQKQCGLNSVCAFELKATNRSTINGYIMRISNGLTLPVDITWDILGNSTLPAPISFQLAAHDSRFINTHQQGIHTIRLQVSNSTVDTEIANPEFACTSDQACEYLVRSCFANNDDFMCKDYANYCQSALKYTNSNIDTFRQACIPNCIAEFYADTIADPYRYKSSEIMQFLDGYYQKVSAGSATTDALGSTSSHSTFPIGGTVAIIVLSAAVLIAVVVGIFVFIQYRRNRLGRM